MLKKNNGFLLALLFLSAAPLWAANPYMVNPPSTLSYRSSGYDPYNTQTLGQGVSLVVQNPNSYYQYFTFTMTRGLYYTRPEATAYTYGRAAKNTQTGDYIGYHLQASAGYAISDAYIYRELQDSPTYHSVATGAISPNKTVTFFAAVIVPAQQSVPPGVYEDTVEGLLYNSLLGHSSALVQRISISVRILVQEYLSFDLKNSQNNNMDISLDFKELKSNEEQIFYFNVLSNSQSLSITFLSENLGRMVHTDYPSQSVSYTGYLDYSKMNLSRTQGWTVQTGSSSLIRFRMRFQVGTVNENLTQGKYRDMIRVNVSTL